MHASQYDFDVITGPSVPQQERNRPSSSQGKSSAEREPTPSGNAARETGEPR